VLSDPGWEHETMNEPTPRSSEVSLAELVRTGAIAGCVMLAAAIVFYGLDVAAGLSLFFTHDIAGSDIWHLNYPMKHFYQEGLAQGRLPLWCSFIGTGFPLHAEGQVAALYPLNLALFWILPLAIAFNWGILIHVVLSGVFAALYARQLGAARSCTLVAAVIFAFSGFFVTHLKHVNMTASAIWIPLLLLLLERYAARRSIKTLTLFALAVGAMVLAGHPQIVFNNLLVAGLYAVYLGVKIWIRKPYEGGRWPNAWRFGGGVGYAVLLGVLLGMPQILPTNELNDLGPRKGGMTLEHATQWQYQWKHLGAFFLPSAFGDPGELEPRTWINPRTGKPVPHPGKPGETIRELVGFEQDAKTPILYWEMTGYVGLLPLALLVVCLVLGWRRPNVRMLLVFLILSLLLCLGKGGGLFYLFYYGVPGFDLFRFHDRFLLYVDLVLAVTAALGLTWIVTRVPGARKKAVTAGLSALALALCFLDLKVALGDHNPRIEAERWTTMPDTARRIQEEEAGRTDPYRMADLDPERIVFTNGYHLARGWKGDLTPYDPARNLLDPNLNLLFDITNVFLYYQLYPRWMMEAGQLIIIPGNPRAPQPIQAMNEKIASLLNVRYFIDPYGYLAGKYPLVAEFSGGKRLQYPLDVEYQAPYSPFRIRLHRNPGVLPRAFLVPFGRVVVERAAGLRRLTAAQQEVLSPDFDSRTTVLIHRERGMNTTPLGLPGPAIEGGVKFENYDQHEVRLEVTAPRECLLFLSDTWYPGWTATVDGVETPIHRANITGRAIQVQAGRHRVVFTYAPASFALGMWIAAVGLLALLTLAFQARLWSRLTDKTAP